MLKDLSKAIRGGHTAQPRCAGFRAAFECLAVHFDDPKCGPVTENPFEVIEQAPIRISPHVNAVIEAATHSGRGAEDVFDSGLIVVGADSFSVTSTGSPP